MPTIDPAPVRLEEVIITNLLRRGKGTTEDPMRIVTQVWTKDGRLIAENDHYNGMFTKDVHI